MNYYLAVLKNYVGFSGRARRAEYWWYSLINFVILVVLSIISVAIGDNYSIPASIYSLAVLLPSLAVGVRRLHDTGRSGWWLLIALVPLVGGIILLVFTLTAGTPGPNQYGQDPKQAPAYA